jgi:penicillin-binding protein 2
MAADSSLKDHALERAVFISRAAVACVIMLLLLGVLVTRLSFLQVFKYDYYGTRSDDNRMRVQLAAPVRGLIYDREGRLLADNLPAYRLDLIPEQVEDIDAALERLSRYIALTPTDLERFNKRRRGQPRFRPVPLRFNLTQAEVARFEVNRRDFPGMEVRAGLRRHYPLGELTSHVVGYVGAINERELKTIDEQSYRGISQIGKSGVELAHEGLLRGTPGSRIVEANALGRPLRELEYNRPTPGQNIHLTLDARLQAAAYAAMGENEGAIVALDPRNGDLLAAVSKPGFDPEAFIDGITQKDYNALLTHPGRPLFDRVLQGQYPPGSTVKPLMALAALEENIIDPRRRVWCPGYFELPNSERKWRDWKRDGHGWVNMAEAIYRSSDVYFYKMSMDLGIDNISRFGARFGLGEPLGIDMPREKGGILPSREWKRARKNVHWFPGETLNTVIGQGYMTSTPLQLAHMTALLAMRGQGWRPRVLAESEDAISGHRQLNQPSPWPAITLKDAGHWNLIIGAMEDVVHNPRGTARKISLNAPYRIAGKTGTSQVYGLAQDQAAPDLEDVERQLRDHALFVAFAPIDDPRIAVAVLIEHGGGGGAVAAPIAREVLDAYLLQKPPLQARARLEGTR